MITHIFIWHKIWRFGNVYDKVDFTGRGRGRVGRSEGRGQSGDGQGLPSKGCTRDGRTIKEGSV